MQELNKTYKENGCCLRMVKDYYASNDAIYLGLIDDKTKELYCDITVNLNFSSKNVIELNNDFINFTNKKLINKIVKDLNLEYLCDDYNGFCSFPVYFLNYESIK